MKRRQLLSGAFAVLAGCSSQSPISSPSSTSSKSKLTTSKTSVKYPDGTTVKEYNGRKVRMKPYGLRKVNYRSRPQWVGSPFNEMPTDYTTKQIEQWKLAIADIGNGGHHPLRTTRGIYNLLHHYHELNDKAYLEKADQLANVLLDYQTTTRDGAYYFNYGFDYNTPTRKTELSSPWWSCMSQGTGLSAFTRLFEATGEQKWKDAADSVFKSFYQFRNKSSMPWVAYVDGDGYVWPEEYPEIPPSHVLNGLIIGLWGVYEYWLVSGDVRAKRFMQASVTTLEAHAEEWRSPGDTSHYSLANNDSAPKHYHRLHIHQWRKLAFITQEPYFERVASQYYQDAPMSTIGCESLLCSRE